MPYIEVNQIRGRDAAMKSAIIKELTDAYARVTGIDPGKIWVKIEETDATDWGIGGETIAERAKKLPLVPVDSRHEYTPKTRTEF